MADNLPELYFTGFMLFAALLLAVLMVSAASLLYLGVVLPWRDKYRRWRRRRIMKRRDWWTTL